MSDENKLSFRARLGADFDKDPWKVIGGFVLGVLVVLVIVGPISISRSRALTSFEQVMLDVLLFIFSSGLAWMLAKRGEDKSILATQRKLGESALRRIDDLSNSCQRLLDYVARCQSKFSEAEGHELELVLEEFDAMGRLGTEIRGGLESAAEDWRRILPEEFTKRVAARGQATEAWRSALDEMATAIRTTQQTLTQTAQTGDQRAAEQGVQLSLLADQLRTIEQKLSVKVEQIRAETGHSVPAPPVQPPKRVAPKDRASMPIGKIILETAIDARSLPDIISMTRGHHSDPKPTKETVEEYVQDLVKTGYLQQQQTGESLVYVATNKARASLGGGLFPPDAHENSQASSLNS